MSSSMLMMSVQPLLSACQVPCHSENSAKLLLLCLSCKACQLHDLHTSACNSRKPVVASASTIFQCGSVNHAS